MRRTDGLYDISRRKFCALAGAGGAGLALAACTGGGSNPDGPLQHDAQSDASGAVCGAATDVGPASGFTLGTPKFFSAARFFVVRDSGGYYALSAICTHQGATCVVQGGNFYCPRHGAQFTFNGAIVSGPVITPLAHYAMCKMANGNLGVTTTIVSAATRFAG